MRRGWLAASVAFLALFAGTAYMASKLALLDALGPGPGFFPLVLGLLGAALALLLIAQVARMPSGATPAAGAGAPEDFIPDGAASGRIIGLIVLLAAAFVALDPLGYRLTALLFITLTLLVLGVRNVPAIVVVALAGSFGVFHSFYYWLKVPLPIGGFGL